MGFCVYILYSESLNKYYVGFTENIETRMEYHNNPIEVRKFTARGIPWKLMFTNPCRDKANAMKMEKYIKSMKSRKYIEAVIAGEIELKNFKS